MSGETTTREVEGVGLFEDEQRSGMCGAKCMRVHVFIIRCEVCWNFNPINTVFVPYILYNYVYVRVCAVRVN